ncbi:MAG: hypothetical protein QQN63_01250 [Nitrosopumilus sp.]
MSKVYRRNLNISEAFAENKRRQKRLAIQQARRLGGITTKLDATSDLHSVHVPALSLRNLGTNNRLVSDPADNYPLGISWMYLSAASGWPYNTGMVITEIFTRGSGQRTLQTNRAKVRSSPHVTQAYERSRNADDTSWEPWFLVSPYFELTGNAVNFNVAQTSVWETFHTDTTTSLHDDFEANVMGMAVSGTQRVNNDDVVRIRVRISVDDGSTYFNSTGVLAETDSSVSRQAMAMNYGIENAAVTDTILVEVQAFCDQTTTIYDMVNLVVSIS